MNYAIMDGRYVRVKVEDNALVFTAKEPVSNLNWKTVNGQYEYRYSAEILSYSGYYQTLYDIKLTAHFLNGTRAMVEEFLEGDMVRLSANKEIPGGVCAGYNAYSATIPVDKVYYLAMDITEYHYTGGEGSLRNLFKQGKNEDRKLTLPEFKYYTGMFKEI